MKTMKGKFILIYAGGRGGTWMRLSHTWCRRIPSSAHISIKALIKSNRGDLKDSLSKKWRKYEGKHIGSVTSMKNGKRFSEAQNIVLARLAGGISSIVYFRSSFSLSPSPVSPSFDSWYSSSLTTSIIRIINITTSLVVLPVISSGNEHFFWSQAS